MSFPHLNVFKIPCLMLVIQFTDFVIVQLKSFLYNSTFVQRFQRQSTQIQVWYSLNNEYSILDTRLYIVFNYFRFPLFISGVTVPPQSVIAKLILVVSVLCCLWVFAPSTEKGRYSCWFAVFLLACLDACWLKLPQDSLKAKKIQGLTQLFRLARRTMMTITEPENRINIRLH